MLPSTPAYAKAIRAFRREYPTVTTLSAWNEASHVTQPTYKRPDAAARYYLAMKRSARRARSSPPTSSTPASCRAGCSSS